MSKNEIELGTMHIEASIVAQGLELEPSLVQAMMRKGEITSLCEKSKAVYLAAEEKRPKSRLLLDLFRTWEERPASAVPVAIDHMAASQNTGPRWITVLIRTLSSTN